MAQLRVERKELVRRWLRMVRNEELDSRLEKSLLELSRNFGEAEIFPAKQGKLREVIRPAETRPPDRTTEVVSHLGTGAEEMALREFRSLGILGWHLQENRLATIITS